jgi:prepilin-type N-terminal cleavage/methylation domain-containing protein
MRRMKISEAKGFTIVELLLVIIILAIVAGAAVPIIDVNLRQYRFHAARDQIYSDLNFARRSARNLNTTVAISFSQSGNGLQGTITDTGNDRVLRNKDYGRGLSITMTNYLDEVRFSPFGIPLDSNNSPLGGSVTLNGPDALSRTFQIFATTGMIR